MEYEMETTRIYRAFLRVYLGTMERNMETTIIYRGYRGGL